jgi:hypothetical protein
MPAAALARAFEVENCILERQTSLQQLLSASASNMIFNF